MSAKKIFPPIEENIKEKLQEELKEVPIKYELPEGENKPITEIPEFLDDYYIIGERIVSPLYDIPISDIVDEILKYVAYAQEYVHEILKREKKTEQQIEQKEQKSSERESGEGGEGIVLSVFV